MPIDETVLTRLTQSEKGIVFLRPCLDVSCYWAGSAFEHAGGIVHFYQRSLKVIGKKLTLYRTETMSKARPLKKDSLGLIPFWFEQTKSRRDIYMLYLESSPKEGEVSDHAFALHAVEAKGEEVGFVRLILPVDFIEKEKLSFIDLTKELVQELEFDSGHAGYSLNWNTSRRFADSAKAFMGTLRGRYPGLDLSHPGNTKYIAGKGIKCVNWLTLINEDSVKRLGGKKKLAAALGKGVVVHEVPHGAIIQAGPTPQIGDVNRRETLPIYHQVGRVLAPLRSAAHPAFLKVGPLVSQSASNEWLARFDE
jgi:hypothetical protein